MRLGLFLGVRAPQFSPQLIQRLAQGAEERGFAALWVGEHVVLFDSHDSKYPYAPDGEFPITDESGLAEPFTTLAFLAAATSTIRIGTAIYLVPQRNPLYTAKEVANLDWLSGGRFEFGIGVGWLREEFDALQLPFDDRGRRNDEYIDVMRTLWCDDVSSFDGEFWTLSACRAYPKPVQAPHPPIHIGGESDIALRRVARLGAHWLPFNAAPSAIAAGRARLADILAEVDPERSIDDVRITATPSRDHFRPEHASAYADAGVEQLVLHLPRHLSIDDADRFLDQAAAHCG